MKLLLGIVLSLIAMQAQAGPVNFPGQNWGVGGTYVSNQTASVITGAAALVYPANPNRAFLSIQNAAGSGILSIKFGSNISGSEGWQLGPGSTFTPVYPPADAIYMKSSSSTTAIILEGIQ